MTCSATPCTITQASATYFGHWHGDLAVFPDGLVFEAGRGWKTFTESKPLIERLCR